MKKIVFLFLVFGSEDVFAQSPKFLIGLNAAGVWNSYVFTQPKEPFLLGGKINWSTGIQTKYFISKKLSMDGQINLSSKNFGSGIDFSTYSSVDITATGSWHYSVRQTFVEVPISANYLFSSSNDVSLFCSLGVVNSFAISQKYASDGVSGPDSKPFERYESYLSSVKIGGGMLFPMGKSFYGSAELYSTIYIQRVNKYLNNPFQLALGFSVLKKFGAKKTSAS